MTEFIQVVTTVSDKACGVEIGRVLVDGHLAACVQVSKSLTSVYRWQGKIEEAKEYTVTIKSKASLFAKIVDAIEKNHPYDIPELIATPLVHCSPKYAEWLGGELQDD